MNPQEIEQQFRQARTRTLRHWYEDGLAETIVGIVFVVVAMYFAAETVTNVMLNLLFPALVIGAYLLSRRFIRRAKERYVYPRTGFVVYHKQAGWHKWVSGVLGGAIAGLTVALIHTAPGLEGWIPAFEGFVLGAFLLWQGRSACLPRLTFMGLLSALLGLVISLGRFPTHTSGALLFGAVGAIMFTSGRLAFRRFLRRAPQPEEP